MKKIIFTYLILLFVFPAYSGGSIEDFLKELPLTNLRVLEKESFYSSIYEVMFEQPIDHKDPSSGTFSQRLYISHIDPDLPVVLVTEGYDAGYYYTSEPANILKCNQIIVEHRYFGNSKPDSMDYSYLNTWQAATDHHKIIEHFSKFYTNKWITTGISKGGQTVMFHSYYYPEDAALKVPYVAPLNYAVEDTRIYDFLDHVGSWQCRRKIHKFQKHALKIQDELLPAFKKFSHNKGYTYEMVGGYEKALEYCILEYSFAFWQWGYSSCTEIPGRRETVFDIILHMNKVGGFDYFADEYVVEYQPFFYQALTEMGYYRYDLSEFRSNIKHLDTAGFEFTMPKNLETDFSDSLMLGIDQYIKNSADNFVFIYGEYDTWSATAVDLGANSNSKVFIKKRGTHRTRIRNMPEEQQEKIIAVMKDYLEEEEL